MFAGLLSQSAADVVKEVSAAWAPVAYHVTAAIKLGDSKAGVG